MTLERRPRRVVYRFMSQRGARGALLIAALTLSWPAAFTTAPALASAPEKLEVLDDIVISSGGTKPEAFYILTRFSPALGKPPVSASPPKALLEAWSEAMAADEAEKVLSAVARSLTSDELNRRYSALEARWVALEGRFALFLKAHPGARGAQMPS